jgi:hypothetical protein
MDDKLFSETAGYTIDGAPLHDIPKSWDDFSATTSTMCFGVCRIARYTTGDGGQYRLLSVANMAAQMTRIRYKEL